MPISVSPVLTALLVGCISPPPDAPAHATAVSAVVDPSTGTAADRCAEFGADLQAVLRRPGVGRVEVTLLAVGDALSGDEPVVVIPAATYRPPRGAFAKPGALERYRFEFVARLVTDCDRRLLRPRVSPIYVAVKRAVESLAAMCERLRHVNVECTERLLFLHTDFRENHEPAIRDRLRGKRSKTPLPRIDVSGIEVSACGVAATYQDPHAVVISPQDLQATWAGVFGTELQIEAGCPALARQDISEAVE